MILNKIEKPTIINGIKKIHEFNYTNIQNEFFQYYENFEESNDNFQYNLAKIYKKHLYLLI